MLHLTITNARMSDTPALLRFLYEEIDPNIRRRSETEITTMIELGLVFVIYDGSQIIGTCYLCGSDDSAWELSGAYIHPAYRGLGLFRLLAITALINLFITLQPQAGVTAIVKSGNTAPLHVLRQAGFGPQFAKVPIYKDDFTGIEHMEADSHGHVYIDIWSFDRARLLSLVELIWNSIMDDSEAGDILITWNDALVRMNLPAFDRSVLEAFMEELMYGPS